MENPESETSTEKIESTVTCGLNDSVTKCSICLDKLRTPKSLPCLHTFCQTCLARYIKEFFQREQSLSWSGFPCPTCRTTATPTDATVDVAVWADQFPTNNFILSVMDMANFEKAEKVCEPCERQHKRGVRAEMWCKLCKVCMCMDCLSFHNAMFLDHHPLSISEAKEEPALLAGGQGLLCSRHKENLNLFCNDHQVLACSSCIAVDHRRCLRVITAEEYAHELKSSKEAERVVQEFNECFYCLENIIQENLQQSAHISNQKQEIINTITDCRRQINAHLDEIQNHFLTKLNDTHKEEADKIDMQIREIRQLQTAVEHSKKMVEAVLRYGGDSQVLSTFLKAKTSTTGYKQKSVETYEKTENVDYSFQLNAQIRKLPSFIRDFGEMNVVRAKRGVPKSVSNMKQMFERKATEIHKFYVRLPSDSIDCVITSGLYLSDGRLIICDFHNRCVKMFLDTGVFITKVLLQSEPFGICKVDDDKVAVTEPNNREIKIISTTDDNMAIVRSLNLDKVCYGIEKFEDELVVLLPMEKPFPCLCTASMDGTVTNMVKKDSTGHAMFEHKPFHLAVNNHTHEICVTQKTTAVHDKRGLVLGENLDVKSDIHHKDIRWARGIEIDFEGNLYMCGQMSSNVVQFNPDCSQSRVILTESCGIQHPAAIGFNRCKFFLTDVGDNNRNLVKIFEMV